MCYRRAIPAFALVLMSIADSHAADCVQDHAQYATDDGRYTLSFQPVSEKGAVVTHLFTLSSGTVVLDGMVMETEEPARSGARISKNCPDGDVTGDDIRACTGFDGFAYAIGKDGTVMNVPAGESLAAPTLLFAGLGPILASSDLARTFKLGNAADVFTMKGCTP